MTFDVWKQAKIQNGLDNIKTVSLPAVATDSIEDMKRLAGIPSGAPSTGMNISITGTEKGELMKKNNIRPGTPEWFKLWFSLPYMTGEKPIGK
jgi:hypothetical protein